MSRGLGLLCVFQNPLAKIANIFKLCNSCSPLQLGLCFHLLSCLQSAKPGSKPEVITWLFRHWEHGERFDKANTTRLYIHPEQRLGQQAALSSFNILNGFPPPQLEGSPFHWRGLRSGADLIVSSCFSVYSLQQRHSFFACQKSSELAGPGTAASSPSTHCSRCLPACWVQQGSPASPAWCRAPQPGRSSSGQRDMDRSLHKGVCFLSDAGSVSGKHCWPGHRAPGGVGMG